VLAGYNNEKKPPAILNSVNRVPTANQALHHEGDEEYEDLLFLNYFREKALILPVLKFSVRFLYSGTRAWQRVFAC
jgi:hypothetical protein